ncbi:hypothetical protein [Dongia rigui]|uniref:Transmembrane protein PGPGW n=1 Tax=Dongia rigui TaxID=940149 RepID=A0ABU5DYA0_9PROT|nr:hypothetical protein [Dongia rigui]MDY0871683.1 hypothetical protein [Dongia rigui]
MADSAVRQHLPQRDAAALAEANIEKLLARLPSWLARAIRGLRRPHARWVRLPVAALLIPGGFLSFLPVFGLWMLPLGLLLLAVDIPLLKHLLYRFINWLAVKRPQWFP